LTKTYSASQLVGPTNNRVSKLIYLTTLVALVGQPIKTTYDSRRCVFIMFLYQLVI
jgi:hypothetical protein